MLVLAAFGVSRGGQFFNLMVDWLQYVFVSPKADSSLVFILSSLCTRFKFSMDSALGTYTLPSQAV